MTAPVVVADFESDVGNLSSRELVAEAVERGAAFVAVDVVDGDDETPQAHVGGRRVASLERMGSEALRRQIGLFLRVRDTLPISAMREALGVAKGSASATLRDRFLVTVDGERVGKRLRKEAPELPSAYEVPVKRSGFARLMSPNMLRAAADADDLVVAWSADAPALVARLAPVLAKRGARVWVSGVPESDVSSAMALPVAGVVVRC